MKLTDQITEECHRFHAFYGKSPDCIYLGAEQMHEFDKAIKCLMRFEVSVAIPYPAPPTFMGMKIYRVDQASYLGFGLDQPSPCG